jgi:hypothetical protein
MYWKHASWFVLVQPLFWYPFFSTEDFRIWIPKFYTDLNPLRPILLSRTYLLKTYTIGSIIFQAPTFFQIDDFQEFSPKKKLIIVSRIHSRDVPNTLQLRRLHYAKNNTGRA